MKKCPNGMFRLVKGLKTDSNEVEGGRCISGRLCFEKGIRFQG